MILEDVIIRILYVTIRRRRGSQWHVVSSSHEKVGGEVTVRFKIRVAGSAEAETLILSHVTQCRWDA